MKIIGSPLKIMKTSMLILIILYPTLVFGDCTCDADGDEETSRNKGLAQKLKIVSMVSILVSGAIGVTLPLVGTNIPTLNPETNFFFLIKAIAAGVILATGFVHILADANEDLNSPCLGDPWQKFPFSMLIAMVFAIGTLVTDVLAMVYYKRSHFNGNKTETKNNNVVKGDEEKVVAAHQGHVHVHMHAHGTHGHAQGPFDSLEDVDSLRMSDLIKKRVISQVLELGIVVHSVIIGISLGASQSPDTIRPLIIALSFHQFFEGMGLGGSISQAKLKLRSMFTMATFFSLTTPIGIVIGMAITNVYKENSPTALIVQGIFNSAAAGILIYMALVDLLAADFMNPRMQENLKLLFGAIIAVIFGAGCMSVLAIWA